MSIGYACLTVGVPNTNLRSCTSKKASPELLAELISHNLESLKHMIQYNAAHDILLFRISSDIIPFGSSPVNTLQWDQLFKKELMEIGQMIQENNIRVSMHPGQYTIINSPRTEVVNRSIADLEYHCRFLDALNTSSQSKIVLHIGGKYDDPIQARKRFIEEYHKLDISIKKRLVIENDDRLYTIQEVLEISEQTNAPVIFDNLHNKVNPSSLYLSESEWIQKANYTWGAQDGKQKIHFSSQNETKQPGAHSDSIKTDEFLDFYTQNNGQNIDIMLEVKDKNLSAVKCINLVRTNHKINYLEEEWGRYKYSILEHSQNDYLQIRKLLKDKTKYPVREFYQIIEEALSKAIDFGNQRNSLSHVWGYFSDICTETEKKKFQKLLLTYEEKKESIKPVKNFLYRLTQKYQEPYLMNSLFFDL